MKWSFSAAKAFLFCPRQWAFAIMAHHSVRDELRRELHVLRQLVTPWGWVGKLVHTALSQWAIPAVRQTGTFPVNSVIAETIALSRRQEAFSRARRYRTESKSGSNGNFLALDCHEDGRDLTEAEREMVPARLTLAIENLAGLGEIINLIRQANDCSSEQRLIWRLDGTVVEATPDLLVIDHAGQPVVVDWKVRDSEVPTAALQLQVGAVILAGSQQVGKTRPEALRLLEANLLRGEVVEHQASVERLDRADDFIFTTLEGMRQRLQGRAISGIDPWAIETTRHPAACSSCRFRSVCGKGKDDERGKIQPRLL